jgi:hypothetical protein
MNPHRLPPSLQETEAITAHCQPYITISWNAVTAHLPCTLSRLVSAKTALIVKPRPLKYIKSTISPFHMYHLHSNLALCACVPFTPDVTTGDRCPLEFSLFPPSHSHISFHSSLYCSISSQFSLSTSPSFSHRYIFRITSHTWFGLLNLLPRTLQHSCPAYPIANPFDSYLFQLMSFLHSYHKPNVAHPFFIYTSASRISVPTYRISCTTHTYPLFNPYRVSFLFPSLFPTSPCTMIHMFVEFQCLSIMMSFGVESRCGNSVSCRKRSATKDILSSGRSQSFTLSLLPLSPLSYMCVLDHKRYPSLAKKRTILITHRNAFVIICATMAFTADTGQFILVPAQHISQTLMAMYFPQYQLLLAPEPRT